MAEIKWIKITTNMFDDEKIKLIDAMPERDTIFYIWIHLLTQAGKCNAGGYIFLSEHVPYTDEMLSTIFNRPVNSVRLALKTLSGFGMIERSENNDIKISNWEKHQNIEGMEKVREQNRLRKRKQRAESKKLKPSPEDVTPMSRDSHATEKEREKERELDLDIDKEKESKKKKDTLSLKAIDLCKYFGEIKPGQSITQHISVLNIYINDYGYDWCKEALKKTVIGIDRFDPNYMLKILKNWVIQGKPKEVEHGTTKKHKDATTDPKREGIGIEL